MKKETPILSVTLHNAIHSATAGIIGPRITTTQTALNKACVLTEVPGFVIVTGEVKGKKFKEKVPLTNVAHISLNPADESKSND